VGLPLNARETVGCETPASWAMSNEVGLRDMGAPLARASQ
jgi:hypothetical protein